MFVLAELTFAAPAWLAVLPLAAAIPLLLHLRGRRHRTVAFPAVRFLAQVQRDHRRIRRPYQWLLLALRLLVFVAIVVAFAQPRWQGQVEGVAGEDVVIVLDRSASMQRVERGVQAYEEARAGAVERLQALTAGDRAGVVLVDARPRALLPELTQNYGELQERLRDLAPTFERGDMAAALAVAEGLLPERGRVVVVTDAQATNWSGDALRGMRERGVMVEVVPVGEDAANLALRNPRLTPARPVAGRPAVATVELASFDPSPREVTVAMRWGEGDGRGGQLQRRVVRVEPFGVTTLSWPATFAAAGETVVAFDFGEASAEDALASDNDVGVVADVAPALRLRLVTQEDASDPRTAAFFVQRALAPHPSAGVALTQDAPDARDATEADAVVIVEAGELHGDALEGLQKHLRRGGGALWLCDSPGAAAALRKFLERHAGAAAVTVPDIAMGEASALRFDRASGTLEPADFATHEITFGERWRIAAAPPASTVARFDDGSPAIVSLPVGDGRLVVVAAALGPTHTSFTKHPLFVPLLHDLLTLATPGIPPEPNLHPGVTLADGATTIDKPGLVTFYGGAARWAELDPAESDLRQAAVTTEVMNSPEPAHAVTTDQVRDLWAPLAMLALVALGAEGLMIARTASRRSIPSQAGVAHA